MFSILLVSHGRLASSMQQSAKMIRGHCRRTYTVEIDENTVVEDLKKQIEQKIMELSAEGKVVVLTDIPIGTPFNVVVSLMSKLDFVHFTGMNLSLVLELLQICEDDVPTEEYCKRAMDRASARMFDVNEFCRHLQLSE